MFSGKYAQDQKQSPQKKADQQRRTKDGLDLCAVIPARALSDCPVVQHKRLFATQAKASSVHEVWFISHVEVCRPPCALAVPIYNL
jgi:hypothetical protein